MVVKGSMYQGVYGVNSTYNVERCGEKVSNAKVHGIKALKCKVLECLWGDLHIVFIG